MVYDLAVQLVIHYAKNYLEIIYIQEEYLMQYIAQLAGAVEYTDCFFAEG